MVYTFTMQQELKKLGHFSHKSMQSREKHQHMRYVYYAVIKLSPTPFFN